jgi:hypothetical protein
MPLIRFLMLSLALIAAAPPNAQAWKAHLSREDAFVITFPGDPIIEKTTWTDFNGTLRPARRYNAMRNGSAYALIVADFTDADYNLTRGSFAHATYVYRMKGEVTFDSWNAIDRVDGHQLQIMLDDGNKLFFAAYQHLGRLYILEVTIVPGSAAPVQFTQGMVFLDEEGVRVRYGVNGERIPRTDDLPDILGGADLDGPIMEGQSDEFIP